MPKKAKPASSPLAADDEKTPALHKAAEDGNCAEVKRLLTKGVDVNELGGGDRWPPLHCSVEFDHPATVGTLIDGGAEIDGKDGVYGRAPLHLAAYAERPAVARVLIARGADMDLRDRYDAAPLHLAAQNGSRVVAGVLIANHAKLNLEDVNGNTPLHVAAFCGKWRVAASLIEARADASKKNKAGRTPLYIAQEHGHNEVADILIAASGNFRNMVAPPPKDKSIPERVYDKAWMSIVAINTSAGSGSGVIIAPGVVATNRHVIEDGGDIFVRRAENRFRISERDEYLAVVDDEGASDMRDLCLLKVEGLECPPIKIRTYRTLRIGEDVYAIGNPEGLELSLSAGIISQLRSEGERRIQTDAAISRGSSGGGLFDRNGNLVGITNSSIDGDKNDAQNLNLAIPADWLLGYFIE